MLQGNWEEKMLGKTQLSQKLWDLFIYLHINEHKLCVVHFIERIMALSL